MQISSAIILAGGLATRLHPLTIHLPKSLIPIQGKPFIEYQLELLFQQGLRDIVLCVGHFGELIQQHIGNGQRFNMNIHYSFDGERLLGTAGAIKKALPLIETNAFFVLYGDSYLTCDYTDVGKHFYTSNKQGLMTIFHNQGRWDDSNVEYSAPNIISYDKKCRSPHMQHIDYGLGIFLKAAFCDLTDNQPYDLTSIYQALLKKNQLSAYEVQQRFYEIGSEKGIKEFENHLCHTIKRNHHAVY